MPTRYYPVCLDLSKKKCIVIGGGTVAERKVTSLLKRQALVTVISPAVTKRLVRLAAQGKIKVTRRNYRKGDVKGAFLVFGATNDKHINASIARDAGQHKALVNIVDAPEICNVIIPASLEHGNLIIAVSTGGVSPAIAARLKRELENTYGSEYGVLLRLLEDYRTTIVRHIRHTTTRRKLYGRIFGSKVLEFLRKKHTQKALQEIRNILREFGVDFEQPKK